MAADCSPTRRQKEESRFGGMTRDQAGGRNHFDNLGLAVRGKRGVA